MLTLVFFSSVDELRGMTKDVTLFMILGILFEPRGSILEVSGRLGRPFHSPELAGVTFSHFFPTFSALLGAKCRP